MVSENSFFMDAIEAKPTKKYAIAWSHNPVSVIYNAPYLIGVLEGGKGVEVRRYPPIPTYSPS